MFALYRISFMYLSTLGFLITFFVGMLASLLTGLYCLSHFHANATSSQMFSLSAGEGRDLNLKCINYTIVITTILM